MARLEIRLEPEVKEKLVRIAEVYGVSVSDLVREGIKIVLDARIVEQYRTVEALERVLVRAIIENPVFQKFLKDLEELKQLEEVPFGEPGSGETTVIEYVARCGDVFATIVKRDEMLIPAMTYDCGERRFEWCTDEVSSLRELSEWLEIVMQYWDAKLRDKLVEISKALRKLLAVGL